jgi:LDH2 family malate/lactate/ureidoglycolate dehydrogenase
MSRTTAPRVATEALRRQAIALGVAAGLSAPRAADLAHHVLWYEVLGAPHLGLWALPSWLEGIASGRHDPAAAGRVVGERTGSARLDAARALPPLAMSQAVAVAAEKARENGSAVLRVENLDGPCPCGDAAAREAVGPVAVLILTARPSWVLAMPGAGDPPTVADTDLAARPPAKGKAAAAPAPPPEWAGPLGPMLAAFAPGPGGAVVLALHVPAIDALDALRSRLPAKPPAPWLAPAELAARRDDAEARGLPVPADLRKALDDCAARLGIAALDA